jgi:DNA replication regulator SLD3
LFSASDPALNALLAPETGFPHVLVARERVSGTLCAMERAGKGQYALCGIGSWVREEQLQISVAPQYARPFTARCTDPSTDWRTSATLPDDGNPPARPAKRIKLSMQRPSSVVPSVQNAQVQSQALSKSNGPPSPIEAPHPPAMTKDQLLETLVCQYLEALYLSRTSLAFFAKGPLSRTRIAFASPTSALSLLDLTNFLKTMILGYYGAIDKKFEKHLPTLVTELALQLSESDVSKAKSRKRRPKKKKLKLGKEGTYPFETGYVKKWWKGDEDTPVQASESPKQRLSRRIGDLRTREALLQVILILEVLALETSLDSSQRGSQLGAVDNDVDASQRAERPKSNAKKPPDINTILDILADKLLIWQDIDLDLGPRADRSPARPTPGKDKLGGFCFEVLIPLYVLPCVYDLC